MNPPRIAFFASKFCNPEFLDTALGDAGFAVTLSDLDALASLDRGDFDVLYLPGGWYTFAPPVVERIQRFVASGGGCVGSCCGAYVIIDNLKLIPGRTQRVSFRGRLAIEPQQGTHPILRDIAMPCTRHPDRVWEPVAMTHLGGPLMHPEDPATILASYDFEGEIGALLAADFGKGRVVAIASHPEMDLCPLPPGDPANAGTGKLPQGDAHQIIARAVRWAAPADR